MSHFQHMSKVAVCANHRQRAAKTVRSRATLMTLGRIHRLQLSMSIRKKKTLVQEEWQVMKKIAKQISEAVSNQSANG